MKLTLGNITLDAPFFQAALSGYTERPMRLLARQYGAPLTFTGVLLDKIALHHKAIKKLRFLPSDDEHPIGAQILGANPETMAKAAASFEKTGYDLIDLNFACPAPKVLRRQRGGFLLTRPDIVIETYRRVRQAVTCPVIMKLRIGWDNSEAARDDFWQICANAADEGVDAIVIHGRTVKQKYRSSANWQILAEVKHRFPQTTIIGSGDLLDAETALDRLNSSGLDGVAIARGAIGNPWIFRDLRAILQGKPKPDPPTLTEQGRVMLKHFEMITQMRETIKAVRFFRKFVTGYCKYHPQRKKVQMALITARNEHELLAGIKHWYNIT